MGIKAVHTFQKFNLSNRNTPKLNDESLNNIKYKLRLRSNAYMDGIALTCTY